MTLIRPLGMATGTCCPQPGASCDCAKDVGTGAEEERGSNGVDESEYPLLCVATLGGGRVYKTPHSDGGPMCRICHEGGCTEVLLSPCNCTGSLATVHKSCLELWLSSSNTNCCELCHARFDIQRTVRPFKLWLRDPGAHEERRLVVPQGRQGRPSAGQPAAEHGPHLAHTGPFQHLHPLDHGVPSLPL
ncbi:E3 ubiquitin-protein ligase MARCHF2-like isoform X3 [Stigmatopora nigra]